MAKLSAAERKKSATYTDADGKPAFPINDKKHARLALAMKSHAPAAEQPKIEARADRMLGKTKTERKDSRK